MLDKIAKHHSAIFLIFNVLSFFILLLIGILYYLIQPFKSESVVFIEPGSTSKIITNLSKEGYQLSKIDKYILIFLGKPQAGWIDIGTRPLNRGEFLHKLTTAKAALVNITLIPGETTAVFFKQLATQLNLDENKLWAEYKKQTPYEEGMFLPNTHGIPKGIDEATLVELLLKYAKLAFKQESMHHFGEFNEMKWHKIVIRASVIQKEAASNDEMPIVASVINNRLDKKMKLQMDGTLNYGLYSHSKITPERIRNDNSGYNTYKIDGLPKEAVCNVSLEAIRAVIYPAKTDYLYFMRDKSTGKHIFTTNVNDHNKAVDAQRGK